MNPVIGVDVSKGESHAQALLDRGVPHGKIFRFNHDLEGLASFLSYIRGVESAAGIRPAIVMEATGHYHSPVVQFLDEHQYLNIVINPLISHNAKKINLRRLKTDAADAHLLGTLYYKEEFEPYKKRGQHLMNLRYLTRQHESLTGMYVQAKLQFQAILDQVFPEYPGVFGDLYSKVSLRLRSRKSIGLITQRNWWPLLALIQVFFLQVSLLRPKIKSLSTAPEDFVLPCIKLYGVVFVVIEIKN